MAAMAAASSTLTSRSAFFGTTANHNALRDQRSPVSQTNVSMVAPVKCAIKSDAEIVQRRAMMAAAAASVLAIAAPAFAVKEGTPQAAGFGLQDVVKKGSKEAKKKFANVCVTNPTASICHG